MSTNDDLNEDWLRARHWDLPYETFEEFVRYEVHWDPAQADEQEIRKALEYFTALPVWRAAPEPLKSEAAAFLERTRPGA